MRWRRRREADLERELRAHLDLEAEEQLESRVPLLDGHAGHARRIDAERRAPLGELQGELGWA